MWCFCGEVMVDCVVIVERRHHVVWRLKTCHEFEVYFLVRCGKQWGRARFGKGTPKDSTESNSWRRLRVVLVIVGDSLVFEERRIAVHVWMVGVGFIALFMTPLFIAVHTGNEDSDE
jgi:hypothetical protein